MPQSTHLRRVLEHSYRKTLICRGESHCCPTFPEKISTSTTSWKYQGAKNVIVRVNKRAVLPHPPRFCMALSLCRLRLSTCRTIRFLATCVPRTSRVNARRWDSVYYTQRSSSGATRRRAQRRPRRACLPTPGTPGTTPRRRLQAGLGFWDKPPGYAPAPCHIAGMFRPLPGSRHLKLNKA